MAFFGKTTYTEQELVVGCAANDRRAQEVRYPCTQPIIGFVFLLMAVSGFAQQLDTCHDLVSLRDGSVFRGTLTEYTIGGNFEMKTWSGLLVRLPTSDVKYVYQKCPEEDYPAQFKKPYTFREKGWYSAPRLATFFSQLGIGAGLHYSAGMQFHRLIGAGIGVGVESLTLEASDVTTIPLFVEARGYLAANNFSPFYNIGVGWAAALHDLPTPNHNAISEWKGGWLGQTQFGFRFRNRFTMHLGLRFQRKTETWRRPWGEGVTEILQKRFEVGWGFVL